MEISGVSHIDDLSMKGLSGKQLPSIVLPSKQCIRSSHPHLLRNYIETLNDYFEDQNIVQKVKEAQHYYDADKVERLNNLNN